MHQEVAALAVRVEVDLAPFRSAMREMSDGLKSASRDLDRLTFNPDKISFGIRVAVKDLGGLSDAIQATRRDLDGLSAARFNPAEVTGGANEAKKSLQSLGETVTGTRTRLQNLGTVKIAPRIDASGAERSLTSLGTAITRVESQLDALERRASRPIRSSATGPSLPPMAGGGMVQGGHGASFVPVGRPARGGVGRAGATVLGEGLGAGAMLTTVLAAVTGKMAADFENQIQAAIGNTSMSPQEVAAMRASVLSQMRLGVDTGEAIRGFKQVENFRYRGAGAANIARVGARFGVATHTPVDETDDVLAGMMRVNNARAEEASRYANMIHFAAAGSAMDVKALERNSVRTVGAAANYLGPGGTADALAAYAALVQHRMKPGMADTNVSGMIQQIAAPTDKALKRAVSLGIGNDFNAVGERREGLSGVLEKVRAAVARLPDFERPSAIKDLFNNKQGGVGATWLTGTARQSYETARDDPRTGTVAAFAGRNDAITPLFNQQMAQTTQAFKALSGEIKADFMPLGRQLGTVFQSAIPVVKDLAAVLRVLLEGFLKLPVPVQQAVLAFGGLRIIAQSVTMLTGFSLVSEKFGTALRALLEPVAKFGKGLVGIAPAAAEGEAAAGGLAAVLTGPVGLAVAGVAAAVAALVIAWKTDFGHIREHTQAFVSWARPYLTEAWEAVRSTALKAFGAVRAFVAQVWPDIQKLIRTHVAQIVPFVEAAFGGLLGWWRGAWPVFVQVLRVAWDTIKGAVKLAWDVVTTTVKVGLKALNGDWGGAWKALKTGAQSAWGDITGWFRTALPDLANLALTFVPRMVAAGVQMVRGLLTGFRQGVKDGGAMANPPSPLNVTGGFTASIPSGFRPGSREFGGVMPWVARSGDEMRARFGVRDIGGRASSGHIKDSDHYTGTALDFMVGRDRAKGDALAAFMQQHAAQEKVKYVIWQQHIWSPGKAAQGWRPMADRGSATANHMDHVHVSYLGSVAAEAAKGVREFHAALRGATGAAHVSLDQQLLDERGHRKKPALSAQDRANFELSGLTGDTFDKQRARARQHFAQMMLEVKAGHLSLTTARQILHKQLGLIDAAEHKKAETAWNAHLKRLAAAQKQILGDERVGLNRANEAAARAGGARADIKDRLDELTMDPGTLALNREERAAREQYRTQTKALGGNTLGPYTSQQQGDFSLAKQLLDATLIDIAQRRAELYGKRDDKADTDFDRSIGQAKGILTRTSARLARGDAAAEKKDDAFERGLSRSLEESQLAFQKATGHADRYEATLLRLNIDTKTLTEAQRQQLAAMLPQITKWDEATARVDRMKASVHAAADTMKGSLSNAFEGLLGKSKNPFGQIASDFSRMIRKMLADWAASRITDKVTGFLDGLIGRHAAPGQGTGLPGLGMPGVPKAGGSGLGGLLGTVGSLIGGRAGGVAGVLGGLLGGGGAAAAGIPAGVTPVWIVGASAAGQAGALAGGAGALGGLGGLLGLIPGAGAAGGILGAISGLFGGGGKKFLGLFADGGTLPANSWGIAGERGPEVIHTGSRPLTVIPAGPSSSPADREAHVHFHGLTINEAQEAPQTIRMVTDIVKYRLRVSYA